MAFARTLIALAVVGVFEPEPADVVPARWRGVWLPRESSVELQAVTIEATVARVVWFRQAVDCVPARTVTARDLQSVLFSCRTSKGALQFALTGGDAVLIAHVFAPPGQPVRVFVLTRPMAAAKPPAPGGPPPSPPAKVPSPSEPRPPTSTPDTGAVLPQFPWPPPPWSLRAVLRPGLGVTADGEALGTIFDRLRAALSRAAIDQMSVFAVGTDGFALISRLESILDDGRPSAHRWSTESVRARSFSVSDYLRALFAATPGRYRVIVFVVTARAVTAGSEPISRAAMERLLQAGAGDLSPELRRTPLPAGGRCEALIYEFYRPSADDAPTLVEPSQLSIIQHLAGAGLWNRSQLQP
jgi:hypothetical protein